MAQILYTKDLIDAKLKAISDSLDEIIRRGGVIYDTALYAYLNVAATAIANAVAHDREFDEELDQIHIQQNT